MKVLLLAGGWSPEREVSLKGGEQIAAALKERGHSVTLCDPAKDFERLMDMAREHDAAFINLHGAPGEDGLVQAILDRVNCRFRPRPAQGGGPADLPRCGPEHPRRRVPAPPSRPELEARSAIPDVRQVEHRRLEPAPFPRHQRRGTLYGPELPVLNGRGSHCGNRRRRP